jgi:hypothetical protein
VARTSDAKVTSRAVSYVVGLAVSSLLALPATSVLKMKRNNQHIHPKFERTFATMDFENPVLVLENNNNVIMPGEEKNTNVR